MITDDEIKKLERMAKHVGKLESRPAMSYKEVEQRREAQKQLSDFISSLNPMEMDYPPKEEQSEVESNDTPTETETENDPTRENNQQPTRRTKLI
jgi:hypothetical protein